MTPYKGDIFVDNNKLISYGITYSVSIDEIITFIPNNEKGLISNGFDMSIFSNNKFHKIILDRIWEIL